MVPLQNETGFESSQTEFTKDDEMHEHVDQFFNSTDFENSSKKKQIIQPQSISITTNLQMNNTNHSTQKTHMIGNFYHEITD